MPSFPVSKRGSVRPGIRSKPQLTPIPQSKPNIATNIATTIGDTLGDIQETQASLDQAIYKSKIKNQERVKRENELASKRADIEKAFSIKSETLNRKIQDLEGRISNNSSLGMDTNSLRNQYNKLLKDRTESSRVKTAQLRALDAEERRLDSLLSEFERVEKQIKRNASIEAATNFKEELNHALMDFKLKKGKEVLRYGQTLDQNPYDTETDTDIITNLYKNHSAGFDDYQMNLFNSRTRGKIETFKKSFQDHQLAQLSVVEQFGADQQLNQSIKDFIRGDSDVSELDLAFEDVANAKDYEAYGSYEVNKNKAYAEAYKGKILTEARIKDPFSPTFNDMMEDLIESYQEYDDFGTEELKGEVFEIVEKRKAATLAQEFFNRHQSASSAKRAAADEGYRGSMFKKISEVIDDLYKTNKEIVGQRTDGAILDAFKQINDKKYDPDNPPTAIEGEDSEHIRKNLKALNKKYNESDIISTQKGITFAMDRTSFDIMSRAKLADVLALQDGLSRSDFEHILRLKKIANDRPELYEKEAALFNKLHESKKRYGNQLGGYKNANAVSKFLYDRASKYLQGIGIDTRRMSEHEGDVHESVLWSIGKAWADFLRLPPVIRETNFPFKVTGTLLDYLDTNKDN